MIAMSRTASAMCTRGFVRARCAGPALLIATLLSAAASLSAATVYKWTDEKGVVNYTTTPPPESRKAKMIDAAPALNVVAANADYDESRYWRDRRQRETLRDLRDERLRGETEALRQARLRQEIALAEAQANQKSAADIAFEQCKAQRRVDCESTLFGLGGAYGSAAVSYPVGVRRRAGLTTVPPTVFSITSNFTPGFSKPLVYTNPR